MVVPAEEIALPPAEKSGPVMEFAENVLSLIVSVPPLF
jgi:hypothetical protein